MMGDSASPSLSHTKKKREILPVQSVYYCPINSMNITFQPKAPPRWGALSQTENHPIGLHCEILFFKVWTLQCISMGTGRACPNVISQYALRHAWSMLTASTRVVRNQRSWRRKKRDTKCRNKKE